MSTLLYFHNTANANTGTFPSGKQSSATANVTWGNASTLLAMDTNIGSGQTSVTGTSLAQTTNQKHFISWFCSPPLDVDQTAGGGTEAVHLCNAEPNLNANFWINGAMLYVWRPSTGTIVGTIKDWAGTSMGGAEPTSANSEQSNTFSFTSSAISALAGDVLILELWSTITQGNSTARIDTFYYDGTTDLSGVASNVTETQAGSVLVMAETLTFAAVSNVIYYHARCHKIVIE